MQGGGNRRDGFFDDPFGNFGGFGGGFGDGFGGQNGLFQSMFGGRDPFDDPFFRQPFGSMFGGNMFGPTIFNHSPFTRGMLPPRSFLQHEEAQPQAKRSRGPIIEEIVSKEEDEESAAASEARGKRKEAMNSNSEVRHGKGKREVVGHDNDNNEEIDGKSKQIQIHGSRYRAGDLASLQQQHQHQQQQPRSQSFAFQSSTVTYGGVNGAYYTSSSSRRTGSDGIAFEERKAANSSTGQAAHHVSRAIHGKGHSLTRKLNSDGRVESNQTLHNLNQDEMGMFESDWGAYAPRGLPGWSGATHIDRGSDEGSSRTGWALPAPEHPRPQHDRHMHGGRGRRGGQSFQGGGGRM